MSPTRYQIPPTKRLANACFRSANAVHRYDLLAGLSSGGELLLAVQGKLFLAYDAAHCSDRLVFDNVS
jgi:hypothetical protein